MVNVMLQVLVWLKLYYGCHILKIFFINVVIKLLMSYRRKDNHI